MRTRARTSQLLSVLGAALLAGCAEAEPAYEPAPDTTTASGNLTVQNDGGSTIYRVRFSATDDSSWGEDRLGSEVIAPASRRTWSVPAGAYHVKIEYQDGSALDSLEVYQVPAYGEAVCRVTGGGGSVTLGRLVVENGSGQAIYRVRFKPVGDADWGIDRLGSETIVDGARRSWDVPAGRYHVKVEFADGRVLDSLEEYAVPAGGEVACAVWRQQ